MNDDREDPPVPPCSGCHKPLTLSQVAGFGGGLRWCESCVAPRTPITTTTTTDEKRE